MGQVRFVVVEDLWADLPARTSPSSTLQGSSEFYVPLVDGLDAQIVPWVKSWCSYSARACPGTSLPKHLGVATLEEPSSSPRATTNWTPFVFGSIAGTVPRNAIAITSSER